MVNSYRSYQPYDEYEPLDTQNQLLGNQRVQRAHARNFEDASIAENLLASAQRPEPLDIGSDLAPDVDTEYALDIQQKRHEAQGRKGFFGLPGVRHALDGLEKYDTYIQKQLDSLALGLKTSVKSPEGALAGIVTGIQGKEIPEGAFQPGSPSTAGAESFQWWNNLFKNAKEIFQQNDEEYSGPIREFLEILPETYDDTHTPKYHKGLVEILNPADPLGFVTLKIGGKVATKWLVPAIKGHAKGLYNSRKRTLTAEQRAIDNSRASWSRVPDIHNVLDNRPDAEIVDDIKGFMESGAWAPPDDDLVLGPITSWMAGWSPKLDMVNPLKLTSPANMLRWDAGRAVLLLQWDLQTLKSKVHQFHGEFATGVPRISDANIDEVVVTPKGDKVFVQTLGPAQRRITGQDTSDKFAWAIDTDNRVANLKEGNLTRNAAKGEKRTIGKGDDAREEFVDTKYMTKQGYIWEYYRRTKNTDGTPFTPEQLQKAKDVEAALTNTQKNALNEAIDVFAHVRKYLEDNGFSQKITRMFDPDEYRARSVKDGPNIRDLDRDRDLRMMQADTLGYFDDEMFQPRLVEKIEDLYENGIELEDIHTMMIHRVEAALKAVAFKKFMKRMEMIAERNVGAELQQEANMVRLFDEVIEAAGSIAPVTNRKGEVTNAADRFFDAIASGDDAVINAAIEEVTTTFKRLDDELAKAGIDEQGKQLSGVMQDALGQLAKITNIDVETNKHLLIADNIANILTDGNAASILSDKTKGILDNFGSPAMRKTLKQLKRIGGYRNKITAIDAEIAAIGVKLTRVTSSPRSNTTRNQAARIKYVEERSRLIDLKHKTQKQMGEFLEEVPKGANPLSYKRNFTTEYTDGLVIELRERFVKEFEDATNLKRKATNLDDASEFIKGKNTKKARDVARQIIERKGITETRKRRFLQLSKRYNKWQQVYRAYQDMEWNDPRLAGQKELFDQESARFNTERRRFEGSPFFVGEEAMNKAILDNLYQTGAHKWDPSKNPKPTKTASDIIDEFDSEWLEQFDAELWAPGEALLQDIGTALTAVRENLGRYKNVQRAEKSDPNLRGVGGSVRGYQEDEFYSQRVASQLGSYQHIRTSIPLKPTTNLMLALRINIGSAWNANSNRPLTSKGRALSKAMLNTAEGVKHFRDLRKPHVQERRSLRKLSKQDEIQDPQHGKLRKVDPRILPSDEMREHFNNGLFFKEGAAREFEARMGQPPGWFTTTLKGLATTSGILKTIKSSADFGTPGIHGMLTMTYAPDQFKEATIASFGAVLSPEEVAKFYRMKGNTMDKMTQFGHDFGTARDQHIPGLTNESDEFIGGKGILGAIGDWAYRGARRSEEGSREQARFHRVGNVARVAEGGVNSALSLTERQFNHLRTVASVLEWEKLETTWMNTNGNMFDLAKWTNRLTGNYSPERAGFTKRQITTERALGFFAPRFLRSTLAVVTDAFRGGVRGDVARQALLAQMFFTPIYYTAIASILQQDVKLDPRPASAGGDGSQFMTWEMAGHNVGLGSTWVSLYRTLGLMLANGQDPQEFYNNINPAAGRDNPFINFVHSRRAPSSQVIWDLLTGQTYLGEPLESPADYAQWAGAQMTPFWVESAFLGDGGHGGVSGGSILAGATELFGARTYPVTSRERLEDARQKGAEELFGQEYGHDVPAYDDLNRLQRAEIDNSPRFGIPAIKEELGDRYTNDEFEVQSKIYWDAYNNVKDTRARAINQGSQLIGEYGRDTRWFRKHVGEVNNLAYAQSELLRSDVFDSVHDSFLESLNSQTRIQPAEDVAYDEYMTTIFLNRNLTNDDGSYDFAQKQYMEEQFIERWGPQVFEYVQRMLELRITTPDDGYPDLLKEMVRGRRMFSFYWDDSQDAVIMASNDPTSLRQRLNDYYAATETERKFMEQSDRELNDARSQISRIRRKLREKDRDLDIYLYRFYTEELAHPANQWDGADRYYRYQRFLEFPYPMFAEQTY